MENQYNNKQNNKHIIEKPIKNPNHYKILWFMFLSAIIIYNVIAILFTKTEEGFYGNGFIGMENSLYNIMFYAFLILSLIQIIIILKLNSKYYKNKYSPIKEKTAFKQGLPVFKFAIAEASAIYGLMLLLVNGNYNHLILFSVLGLFGMILAYPKE
ncbi:MAG: hypothetical protein KAS78_00070 [Candidatus Pacebacteria bacterium]|nr:hypothetical protein [Candidatus Paceibacterota bacterium]